MSSTPTSRTVLVTGAAGGLGKEIAAAFLSAGDNVAICDIHPTRLSAIKSEWSGLYADRFFVQQADVSDESSVANLVHAVVDKFRHLDILVNNAGILDTFAPAGECSLQEWERVMGVNLRGPFLTTKAAIQARGKEEDKLTIINIGSVASARGFCAGAAYTASKTGLVGLTKNTAGYYGPKGVSCIALLLGGMSGTNIGDAFATGMHTDMMQRVLASQTPVPSEAQDSVFTPVNSVAKYCLFLADSDIAPVANGSCVTFNRNWPEA